MRHRALRDRFGLSGLVPLGSGFGFFQLINKPLRNSAVRVSDMPISVKVTGAKEMARDLAKMRKSAVPYAMRAFVNGAAFETRTIWQREIRSSFTNRNQYTARSVRVDQAKTLDVSKMVATVGSVADYMGTQESGGVVKGKTGHKVIPTAVAAGQADLSKRTRLVRGRFYLGAINVAHPGAHGGRRQSNAIAIAIARKTGKNIALLTKRNGGKGLFLISGGKRALRTRMLWDVSRASVHVKAEPTLERSLAAVRPKLQHMLEAALRQQLQRLNLPGY